MHIHIKPFRFIFFKQNTKPKQGRKCEEQTKKVVNLRFLFSESHSWVKLPRHQPLIHHKYVTIKEQPKKKKSVVHSRIFG